MEARVRQYTRPTHVISISLAPSEHEDLCSLFLSHVKMSVNRLAPEDIRSIIEGIISSKELVSGVAAQLKESISTVRYRQDKLVAMLTTLVTTSRRQNHQATAGSRRIPCQMTRRQEVNKQPKVHTD